MSATALDQPHVNINLLERPALRAYPCALRSYANPCASRAAMAPISALRSAFSASSFSSARA
jgi:hypothetical protein